MKLTNFIQIRGTFEGGKIWIDWWDIENNTWQNEGEYIFDKDTTLKYCEDKLKKIIRRLFNKSLETFFKEDLG